MFLAKILVPIQLYRLHYDKYIMRTGSHDLNNYSTADFYKYQYLNEYSPSTTICFSLLKQGSTKKYWNKTDGSSARNSLQTYQHMFAWGFTHCFCLFVYFHHNIMMVAKSRRGRWTGNKELINIGLEWLQYNWAEFLQFTNLIM